MGERRRLGSLPTLQSCIYHTVRNIVVARAAGRCAAGSWYSSAGWPDTSAIKHRASSQHTAHSTATAGQTNSARLDSPKGTISQKVPAWPLGGSPPSGLISAATWRAPPLPARPHGLKLAPSGSETQEPGRRAPPRLNPKTPPHRIAALTSPNRPRARSGSTRPRPDSAPPTAPTSATVWPRICLDSDGRPSLSTSSTTCSPHI